MIQKSEVMQHVLVPPKAEENNLGPLPKENDLEARTTRGALGRRTRPSSRVVDQVSELRKHMLTMFYCRRPSLQQPLAVVD